MPAGDGEGSRGTVAQAAGAAAVDFQGAIPAQARQRRETDQRAEALASVVEASDDIVVVKDLDLRVLATNSAFARASGHATVAEMIGKTDAELFGVSPDVEPVRSYMEDERRAQTLERGQYILREEPVVYPDGQVRIVLTKKYPIFDELGRVIGTGNISRDITRQKELEAERIELERRRLAEKTESLKRMSGAVAHHFNNMLSAVIGNLELYRSQLSSAGTTEVYLVEAERAAHRAADVGGMLLTYLGQTQLHCRPMDLGAFCTRHLPAIRASLPSGLRLEPELPDSGPVVEADATQLLRVVLALVVNAGEAMQPDTGALRISVTTARFEDFTDRACWLDGGTQRQGRCACLSIRDEGRGMNEAMLERIFDPFFTDKFTGRGLGLPVALGILKAHGGAIAVDSEPGRGSTFRVLLPLSEAEVPASDHAVARGRATVGGTVLVVDDQEAVLSVAQAMLERFGFRTICCRSGEEAVAVVRSGAADIRLVLCDLSMPGLNGWQTLSAMRRIRGDLPVILSSGHDEAQAMQGFRGERPDAFLQKPYGMVALESALQRVLGNR